MNNEQAMLLYGIIIILILVCVLAGAYIRYLNKCLKAESDSNQKLLNTLIKLIRTNADLEKSSTMRIVSCDYKLPTHNHKVFCWRKTKHRTIMDVCWYDQDDECWYRTMRHKPFYRVKCEAIKWIEIVEEKEQN